MQEQLLFEYAVIRIVPRVEREEFLNVGVVLYCVGKKFLKGIYKIDRHRLSVFAPQTDIDEVASYLKVFEQICSGSCSGSSIGKLPVAERFRWLTATRSTVVQCSKVHPGLCADPAETLERLYAQLVC